MDNEIENAAQHLANQRYITVITKDKTTYGKDILLAQNPQLHGCMAQGYTEGEALDNLLDARTEYIKSLLEDGEPIPLPYNTNSR